MLIFYSDSDIFCKKMVLAPATILSIGKPALDMPVEAVFTEEEIFFLDSLVEVFIQNID
jgi:hypothetical protein